MSSFETQRRLTVVNGCANVVDFTGGREALSPSAFPSPCPCAAAWAAEQHGAVAAQPLGYRSQGQPSCRAAPEVCLPALPVPASSRGSCRDSACRGILELH